MGTWDLDIPTGILVCSDTCKANYGRRPDDTFTNADFAAAVHDDDRVLVRRAVDAAMARAADLDLEYRTRWPDGSVHWIQVRGGCELDAAGHVVGLSGVSFDVTAHKRSEEGLRAVQAQVEATLAAGEVATWTWDVADDRIAFDPNLAHLFGVPTTDTAKGQLAHYLDAVHPDDRDTVSMLIRRAISTREPYEASYRVQNAEGEYRSVIARGKTEYDAAGVPFRMPGVIMDVTRQKRVEAELRDSQERYRSLFETIDEGFCLLEKAPAELGGSLDFRFVEANPAFLAQSGVSDAVGRTLRQAFPSEAEASYAAYDEVLRTGKSARFERELESQARVLEVYAFRVLDGLNPRVAVIFKDISARRRAESELRASEERFRTLVQQVEDYAIFRIDEHGCAMSWNEGVRRVLGFEEDEFIGADIACRIFSEEDVEAGVPVAELRQAAEHGASNNERWMRKKDGTPFFAVGVTTRLRNAKRQLTGFTQVMRDQTVAKRAADSTRFLADASAELVSSIDYERTLGRIAQLAVTGFADECSVEVLDEDGKRRCIDQSPPDSTQVVEAVVARAAGPAWPPPEAELHGVALVLRTGQPELVPEVTEAHLTAISRSPEHLEALRRRGVSSYICVPLVSRGTVSGAITFLSDRAGRSYSGSDLKSAQDLADRIGVAVDNARLCQALRDADQRKDEFLATLAHELRNPLAPIRTGLQILKISPVESSSTARVRDMMERQLSHMVRLIDELLDISRASRGRIDLKRERMTVKAVIDAAVETSLPLIEAAHHALSVRAVDEPLYIDADGTRMSQAVGNLLHNAAKYTPEGGHIELEVKLDAGSALIAVTDDGIGIAPAMLPKVFELFAQVGNSMDRAQAGLGIGLSLAKRIVELHGGTLTGESPGLGRGSTFSIRLPLGQPAEPSHAESAPVGFASPPQPISRRILVVDDNVDGAESLAMMLEFYGHEARVAHDGLQALEMARRYGPELVFLDIGLPGMNGYEVAQQFRADPALRHTVLVALTGWGSDEDKQRSKDAGVDYHLTKPVDVDKVTQVLAQSFSSGRPRD